MTTLQQTRQLILESVETRNMAIRDAKRQTADCSSLLVNPYFGWPANAKRPSPIVPVSRLIDVAATKRAQAAIDSAGCGR